MDFESNLVKILEIMKNIKIYLGVVVMSLVVLSSCMEENPEDFDVRDDFVGSWQASEQSQQFGNSNYSVSISKHSSDSTKIYINNFYQIGTSERVVATVDGNQLSIPLQSVNARQFVGSGSLVSGTITISHTASDGSATDNVTVTYVN